MPTKIAATHLKYDTNIAVQHETMLHYLKQDYFQNIRLYKEFTNLQSRKAVFCLQIYHHNIVIKCH